MTYCPICGCVLNEGNVSNRWYYGKRVCNHCEKVIKKIKNFNKKTRRRFAKKNLRENFEEISLKDFYSLNKFFGGNKKKKKDKDTNKKKSKKDKNNIENYDNRKIYK